MKSNYLTTMTVQIPQEGTVIRNGKTVEYQMDRTYAPEDKSTRVKRKVIGKVDPLQPGRMFPNELYFEIFPDNEVPEEIRDEFLRDCAIKREMKVIRRNPEEVVDMVINGLDEIGQWAGGDGANRPIRIGPASSVPTGPRVPNDQAPGPVQIRRMFDELYYAIEELAGKFPNEVLDPFKVERINEVLEEMSGLSSAHRYLRLIEEGLTYSDVLMLMKWYKVMPR